MSRWAGWKVLVEIYEGNFSMPGDADEWAEYLRKHLPEEFPGAEISVPVIPGVEGAGASEYIMPIGREADYREQRDADFALAAVFSRRPAISFFRGGCKNAGEHDQGGRGRPETRSRSVQDHRGSGGGN